MEQQQAQTLSDERSYMERRQDEIEVAQDADYAEHCQAAWEEVEL